MLDEGGGIDVVYLEGQSWKVSLQLWEIMEIWTDMLDEGSGIDVVYLDFRRAFDRVPYQRLLKKAQVYGIDGCVLKWIRCVLTDRKQRVIVKGKPSSQADIFTVASRKAVS